MKSYSDLQEDLEQRRKELKSKQQKQIEDRKKKAVSYRDIVTDNMEKEKKIIKSIGVTGQRVYLGI